METIYDMALADRECKNTFDKDDYYIGLKGYKNDTRGVDSWTATSLKQLPTQGKVLLAIAFDGTYKKAVQPVHKP